MRHSALLGLLFALVACERGDDAPSAAFQAARAKAAPAEREWRVYHGDRGGRQWSPLAEIHRDNVQRLRPVWEYAAGGTTAKASTQIQCNPLVVEGVLYGVSPDHAAFALDAATGAELWTFAPEGAVNGTLAPTRCHAPSGHVS